MVLRNLVGTVEACLKLAVSTKRVDLERVKEAVSKVTPESLNVTRPRFEGASEHITFIHVGETDDFLMTVFVLPPGAVIPLHDHPNMTVFSKVLWGSMEVRSFDFLEEELAELNPKRGKARIAPPKIVQANEVSILEPLSCNVHSFRALEWTAVFDLAFPPYSVAAGRPCTYYEAASRTDGGLTDLLPTNCPDSYRTAGQAYQGEPL